MLQSLFRTLARRWTNRTRSAAPVRSPRASTFRPQLEGLEDRLALSTANLTSAGVLVINETAGTTTQQTQVLLEAIRPTGGSSGSGIGHVQLPTQMKVSDPVSGKDLGIFAIDQIKSISVTAAGNDTITFDFTNGLMFKQGVTVTMKGGPKASNNTFNVEGGPFNQTETLSLSAPGGLSKLSLGGSTYQFDSTFSNVDDQASNTGNFSLSVPGTQITVNEGRPGQSYEVSSPGLPSVTFSNKSDVHLEMEGSGSVLTLNTSGACAGLKFFGVDMNAANQTINLNGEDAGVDDVFNGDQTNDTINVTPISKSLANIRGNLQINAGGPSLVTLNVDEENNGDDPQGISVAQGPVQVKDFTPTLIGSFTVLDSDSNVLIFVTRGI